jgi:hypothetical protein
MKKVLFSIFTAFAGFASAQLTTANPDTVCFQSATPSTYTVPSAGVGGTYTWTLPACATIISGQGTNNISVNWSNCPAGLITNGVSVIYTNTSGCSSPPVNLNVLIYQIVPTITAIGPFCEGAACVTLVGTPAGGVFSGPGVIGNQFCPTSAVIGTNTITYTITSGGCTFSTTTPAVVSPNPTLSPIQHN